MSNGWLAGTPFCARGSSSRLLSMLENKRRILIKTFVALIVIVAGIATPFAQKLTYRTVKIHNDVPRRDTKGTIVDAHDGNLQVFDGRYYLYGTAYGRTAGYSINNRFRVYSSCDLKHWRFEGELLKEPPDGVYYRPYVVYNSVTRKYVLWYNWYPKLWEGHVGVAISDTPTGPFTIVNSDVKLSKAADHPGDGSLFVDKDKIAYFIYTVIGLDHSIFIERLTADYLSSSGEVSPALAKGCEAPALIRNSNTYYALFDSTCCFCKDGSGARVYIASHPFGPYALTNNINRDPSGAPIIHAQQTYIANIPTRDGSTFMWMADRWGSRPDRIKGHDFQYWLPLQFTTDGTIEPLKPVSKWSVDAICGMRLPIQKNVYIWPKKPDPHPIDKDVCSGAPLTSVESGTKLSPRD
jgi:Glycosyl hydrolases family 43